MEKDIRELLHLKKCLRHEVICSEKPFSWRRAIHRAIKCYDRRFYFWWRLANYLYITGKAKNLAEKINFSISRKYGTEIMLGASIEKGLYSAANHLIPI